ncbi:MAG: hypothetical protein V7K48_06695 [Nostoc sp.]
MSIKLVICIDKVMPMRWERTSVIGVNLTVKGRLETASTQAKPTSVG